MQQLSFTQASLCRAALRALILHDSKARLLVDGGMTVSPAASTAPEASIQAICVALAHFYRQHCFQDGKVQAPVT